MAPLKVFGSMRFRGENETPMKEAFELQAVLLANHNIKLVVVRVAAGSSIQTVVFQDNMAQCVGFVAMGTDDYGEDTGNSASSHFEVAQWKTHHEHVWGGIIPLRLIDSSAQFK